MRKNVKYIYIALFLFIGGACSFITKQVKLEYKLNIDKELDLSSFPDQLPLVSKGETVGLVDLKLSIVIFEDSVINSCKLYLEKTFFGKIIVSPHFQSKDSVKCNQYYLFPGRKDLYDVLREDFKNELDSIANSSE